MVVWIAGKRTYLWCAVDHEGEILDVLLQRRRDCRAAVKLMRKLFRKQGFAPKRVITDHCARTAPPSSTSGSAVTMSKACDKTIAREFTQGRATARAQDAALQITGLGAAVSQYACGVHNVFNLQTASGFPVNTSDLSVGSGGAMAQRNHSGMVDGSEYTTSNPEGLS